MRGWIPTKTNQTRSGGLNSFIFKTIFEMHSLTHCGAPSQAWSVWSPAQNRDSKQNITVSKQAQLQRTLNKDGGGKDAVTVCLWLGWLEALAMNGGSVVWWYAEPSPAVTMASILRF